MKIQELATRLKTQGGKQMVKRILWGMAATLLLVAGTATTTAYVLNNQAIARERTSAQTLPNEAPEENQPAQQEKNANPAPNLGGGNTPTPSPTEVPTSIPATTVPVPVVPVPTVESEPSLFDANDCPKENTNGCTFDIGVNFNSFQHQIGIVFGASIDWQGRTFGGPNGCALVILRPGFYPGLHIVSGRFEIYEVPPEDFEGWVRVLATQRADEQSAHFGCPRKSFEQIPQLSSGMPSPP